MLLSFLLACTDPKATDIADDTAEDTGAPDTGVPLDWGVVDACDGRPAGSFEDWFEAGDIKFDYRMKPGPVTRSNALALMRAVGLDVASL